MKARDVFGLVAVGAITFLGVRGAYSPSQARVGPNSAPTPADNVRIEHERRIQAKLRDLGSLRRTSPPLATGRARDSYLRGGFKLVVGGIAYPPGGDIPAPGGLLDAALRATVQAGPANRGPADLQLEAELRHDGEAVANSSSPGLLRVTSGQQDTEVVPLTFADLPPGTYSLVIRLRSAHQSLRRDAPDEEWEPFHHTPVTRRWTVTVP